MTAVRPEAGVRQDPADDGNRLGLFDTCPRVEMAHRTAPV